MRIGELSQRSGVSTRMLRYYEEQGLIAPLRRDNGYREYDEDLVTRVAKIRGLRDSGIPVHIIGDMLSCLEHPQDAPIAPDPELRATLVRARERMSECVELLHRHRDALSRYIETMDQAQTLEHDREPQRGGTSTDVVPVAHGADQ